MKCEDSLSYAYTYPIKKSEGRKASPNPPLKKHKMRQQKPKRAEYWPIRRRLLLLQFWGCKTTPHLSPVKPTGLDKSQNMGRTMPTLRLACLSAWLRWRTSTWRRRSRREGNSRLGYSLLRIFLHKRKFLLSLNQGFGLVWNRFLSLRNRFVIFDFFFLSFFL